MNWGHKPVIENDLDRVINHTDTEEIKKKYPFLIYKFASGINEMDKEKINKYLQSCKAEGQNRSDVFYIIDHANNLTGLDKLFMKIKYLLF